MTGLLSCHGVSVAFGGVRALDGLDFALARGEVVGLIGPNGSGKTTLFNALTGLAPLASGRIWIEDREVTGQSPQQAYWEGIVRTFQRSRLCLDLSVFDNVIVGDQRNLDLGFGANLFFRRRFIDELEKNIERVRSLLGTFSPTLADRLFERVRSLSMIDRRRIEVCRALIGNPRLILLDEPSAGMTEEEAREFMGDVVEYHEKSPDIGIVIIEHEMNLIRRVADRCVVLNFGRKVAEGSYEQVTSDPWVREAYLGVA